jgi:hypothetical protein
MATPRRVIGCYLHGLNTLNTSISIPYGFVVELGSRSLDTSPMQQCLEKAIVVPPVGDIPRREAVTSCVRPKSLSRRREILRQHRA